MTEPIRYDDIADIYDIFVHTNLDIPFFVKKAQKTQGRILELMCGTGRVSIPIAESGANLTCVDLAPEMLAIFRQKLAQSDLNIEIHQMDVCELDLPGSFELIFIPFHAFAEILSPENQRKTLMRIYDHLSDTGRFICTLHNPPIRLKSVDGTLKLASRYPMENGGTLMFWLQQSHDPVNRQINGLEFFEVYDSKGILQSKRMMAFNFHLFSADEFEELAYSEGFKIAEKYGDYTGAPFQPGSSPFMIWVLEKG